VYVFIKQMTGFYSSNSHNQYRSLLWQSGMIFLILVCGLGQNDTKPLAFHCDFSVCPNLCEHTYFPSFDQQ